MKIYSLSNLEKLRIDLKQAGINVSADEYASIALPSSIVISLFLTAGYFLSSGEAIFSIAIFFAALSVALYASMTIPAIVKQSRAERIESELPVILRMMAVEINMKIPFEKTLENIGYSSYYASLEFKTVSSEVEKSGASVQEALVHASERVHSIIFKRAVAQLIFAYETGSDGEPLKKLADELMQIQKAKAREHSAKLAVMGLLFITLSCILPALFQVYSIVGSTFLATGFSTSDVWLAYLVAFPSINLLVLAFIQIKTPTILQMRNAPGFLSRKEKQQFTEALKELNVNMKFTRVFAISTLASILLFILAQAAYLGIYSFIILLLPVGFYLLLQYKVEKKNAELEQFLPDALFQASSLQKAFGIEKTIQSISKSNYGVLSKEFTFAHNQIAAGSNVQKALQGISERNNSLLLERCMELLARGYATGADMKIALKETAEDIFTLFSIVRERASSLAIQKYTLLLGGGIIVPIMLGTVFSFVSSLDYSGLETISNADASERTVFLENSLSAVQAYLAIFAALSSLFIAQQEGSTKRAIIYFLFLTPLVLLLFNFARSTNIFNVT